MESISLGLAFVAGLLSFLSPCVLPLVPAYIGYLGGRMTAGVVGIGETSKRVPISERMQLVIHGLSFVAGFTTIFVLFGAVISALFSGAAPALKDIIGRLGGVLIITFGLHTLGVIPILFKALRKNTTLLNTPLLTMIVVAGLFALVFWAFGPTLSAGLFIAVIMMGLLLGGAFTQPSVFWSHALDQFDAWFYADTRQDMSSIQPGSLIGSFMMGVIFAAGWTPCIGPMLGGIMGIAARGDQLLDGIVLFTAYSLGLGVPFLVAALLLQPMQSFLRRVQRSMRMVKIFSGVLMLIIGVLVARGDLAAFSRGLASQFADFSYRLEECGTGIAVGNISLGHVGRCMDGVLRPIALNQGAGTTLSDKIPEMIYVVRLDLPLVTDVELNRVSDPQLIVVTVKNVADEILAKSDKLIRLDEKRYTAIANLELPAGQYQIIVARIPKAIEDVDFRVKLRVAQPLPEQPVRLDNRESPDADSPIIDLALQGATETTPISTTPTIPPLYEGSQGQLHIQPTVRATADNTPTYSDQRTPDFP